MSPEKMSKRQERRAKLQRQQRQQRLIIIGVVVAVAAILVFAVVWRQIQPAGEIVKVTPAALPTPNGLSLGNANATVTIDVFEDFQCPACKAYTEGIEPLVIDNLVTAGKARYVFHNYPFLDDRLGKGGESDQTANASMCANEQGKFWEMHAALYANQLGENAGDFNNRRLQAIADSVGLDMTVFNTCFSANKYDQEIQADLALGQQMGVEGTPTVFVNGVRVGAPGAIAQYNEIAQAVEQALNQ